MEPTLSLDKSSSRLPSEVTAAINPTTSRRLWIVLSFPFLILLAGPFWWYTTSIQRLPLPSARIAALESSQEISVRSQILLSLGDGVIPAAPAGKPNYDMKTVLDRMAQDITKGIDGIYIQEHPPVTRKWDIIFEEDRNKPPPLRVHMRIWDGANSSFPLEAYIQAPEEGLVTSGIPAGTLVIPVHPDHLKDRFVREHYRIALIRYILAMFPVDPPEVPLRALKYSPNITLSFVLLNEDSSEGSYVRSWDIDKALKGVLNSSCAGVVFDWDRSDHIIPHLTPLAPIHNFTIESQLLYHAPLSFGPTFGHVPQDPREIPGAAEEQRGGEESTDNAWLIDDEGMKMFVNSEQWSLDSGSTNYPVLRFLLFVPSQKHRPMQLALPNTAQSFLLPQYGGVVILNPPLDTASSHSYHLPLSALAPSFDLFTQHLYSLLALPPLPENIKLSPPASPLLPPSKLITPLSNWQVDTVLRTRGRENDGEARKTLAGITRLVEKIEEMKVGEAVRGKVLGAVERMEILSKETNRSFDPLDAFLLSRDAVGLANQAFFDPSMMGLLYFPDEHKFAVYTPLFAPVALPMLIGLLKELLAWNKRRQARKAARAPLAETNENTATSDGGVGVSADKDETLSSPSGAEEEQGETRTLRARRSRKPSG
ncbi:GPI-anchor transamidase subunit S, partial [Tremellales sp. Uapishka_1]